MLQQKVSSMHSVEQVNSSAELSIVENESSPSPKNKSKVDHDGSVGSHLAFGLGTLAFVSPMLMPGNPLGGLSLAYVGLLTVAIVGYICWSVFSTLKKRQSGR